MNPFFSIITPVYNREKAVQQCIGSVLTQSDTDYEMILINDGSRDDTVNKIRAFVNPGSGSIKLIDYPSNKGVNYARNRGIEQAKGKFLVFLDSDDHLTSDLSLELIKGHIVSNPGYRHYLFLVSDREQDPALPTTIFEYGYGDWITGKATGDYVHVVSPDCFEEMLFLEEFRIYEALNWLRVLRKNEKQLYIPVTITTRYRGGEDSVTRETLLHQQIAQKNKFNFLEKYLQWYAADYYRYGMTKKVDSFVKTAVVLGIALGENEKNKKIIDAHVRNPYEKFLFKRLNSRLLKGITSRVIRMKSLRNQRKSIINKQQTEVS
ncbi:MAG TPA: glycosyltransferase family 2 protein [Puia sp.]|nr:glycosyltransferase family 2 protein [Puia sp.]